MIPRGSIWRNEECLWPEAMMAHNPLTRLRGLLGQPPLTAGQALWLRPCNAVHTIGMRYALDVLFLDQKGTILHTRSVLAPGRFLRHGPARQTVEAAAGTIRRFWLTPGQVLAWKPLP